MTFNSDIYLGFSKNTNSVNEHSMTIHVQLRIIIFNGFYGFLISVLCLTTVDSLLYHCLFDKAIF